MQVKGVQLNNYNSQTKFGMALNIDKIKTSKRLVPEIVEKIEQMAPNLERVSRDVEVTFKPDNFDLGRFGKPNLIKMTVEDKNISLQDKIMSLLGLRHPYKQTSYHFFSDINEKHLWGRIAKAKQAVLGLENKGNFVEKRKHNPITYELFGSEIVAPPWTEADEQALYHLGDPAAVLKKKAIDTIEKINRLYKR